MSQSTLDQTFGTLELFRQMVKRVPAYSAFLKQTSFDTRVVRGVNDLTGVPIMDKKNYIDQFSLAQLCWDGKLEQASYIVNSSGSTGVPYFWPRDQAANEASGLIYELILRRVLSVTGRVLLINSFGQGSWIAGIEAFLASQKAHAEQLPIVAINSGIDSGLIVEQLKGLAPFFDTILFTGYPPFIKDVFDTLRSSSTILSPEQRILAIVGGESISEAWRQHVSLLLPTKAAAEIISIYGMSDGGGILAFETPRTLAIRQHIFDEHAGSQLSDMFGGMGNSALFQYDPRRRYFRQGPDGRLLIHNKHSLPLFNYDTKDQGGIVSLTETQMACKAAGMKPSARRTLLLPFVYLLGRSDLCVTFYGLNVYPEHIRACLDELADPSITGRFVAEKCETKAMNQALRITVELADRSFTAQELADTQATIRDYLYVSLPRYNLEYAKLVSSLGTQVKPTIILSKYGGIGYVTGRKHKWVKKD